MAQNLNARLIPLHDTEANWDRVSDDFIPLLGEPVQYDPDEAYSYTRIKYGDGKTKLKDLKFSIHEEIMKLFNNKDNDILYIDSGKITDYYNSEESEVEE